MHCLTVAVWWMLLASSRNCVLASYLTCNGGRNMDERFTRLFSLPENLGLDGCPIVISAGVLLKDNATRNILVQLKLRNLSPREIKAVQVKINAYDITGAVLEGVNTFSYLDLSVPLDGDFGSQTPIWLPDATARSFTVDILSVTLADGTVYVPVGEQGARTVEEDVQEKIKVLDRERVVQAERERKKTRNALLLILLFLLVFCAGAPMFIIWLMSCAYRTIWR